MIKFDWLLIFVAGVLFVWACVLQSITAEQTKKIDDLEQRIEQLQRPVKPCPFDYSQMGRMA